MKTRCTLDSRVADIYIENAISSVASWMNDLKSERERKGHNGGTRADAPIYAHEFKVKVHSS